MKTIMSKSSLDSFSFSRRYFHWKKKVEDEDDDEEILTYNYNSSSLFFEEREAAAATIPEPNQLVPVTEPKKKQSLVSVSRLRSAALSVFGRNRATSTHHRGLGSKVIGTLFGYRRGHVHFAFQEETKLNPALLIELAIPTSVLVKEMASGLVRMALECDKKTEKKGGMKLLEEPLWRTYCNGKKCGYALRREFGAEELKVLKAVEPISMGAGVLPGSNGDADGCEGEVMYMRAKFERVVGSKDSEAFYMMNPDGSGGPELSIYLLRV